MIHIVMGLPGSGKTETAKYLEKKLKGVRINTDNLFLQLYPDKDYSNGDFPADCLEQIYRTLGVLAYYLEEVDSHKHFILEGSFRFKEQRENIFNQIGNKNIKVIFVEINDENIIRKRITKRHKKGIPNTYKDYLKIKETFEKPRDKGIYLLDNSYSIKLLQQKLDDYVKSLNLTV